MKVTQQYLRKLIRETMQNDSQPMNEAEGQRIFFVGAREAYENDMIYGVFDNEQAAVKALKTLKDDPEATEYETEGYQIWSYQVTNKISMRNGVPDIIDAHSLEDMN